MKTTLVLAMHGAPPRDFPPLALAEFFDLHTRIEHSPPASMLDLGGVGGVTPVEFEMYEELELKMRLWPRSAENDPFHTASLKIAEEMAQQSGWEVLVGFNEFCAPTVDEALEQAVLGGAQRVVVVTPMLTPGGEHAEFDIPQAISRARDSYPTIEFVYAWPIGVERTALFLIEQVKGVLAE
jgi:sirohydrochlorin cobaltochelatase